jgi:hypothetical protein
MKMKIDYLPIRPLIFCEERMARAGRKHAGAGVDLKGKQFQYDEHMRAALEHLRLHEEGAFDPDGSHFAGFVTRALLAFDAILDGRVRKTCACGSGEPCTTSCESCSEPVCVDCSSYVDPPDSRFCNASAKTDCGRTLRNAESSYLRKFGDQ